MCFLNKLVLAAKPVPVVCGSTFQTIFSRAFLLNPIDICHTNKRTNQESKIVINLQLWQQFSCPKVTFYG